MKYAILFLLLTSCAGKERIVIQETKTPVPVSCVEKLPEGVKKETDILVKSDPTFKKVQAILIDFKNFEASNNELNAILITCAG